MGELIVSAVTADQALPAAQSVCSELQTGAWFVDLNSVSPGEKIAVGNQITKAGGRFIEAAVMSPIGRKGIATAILLAGPLAQAFVDVGRQLGFTGMRVLSDQAGRAAALLRVQQQHRIPMGLVSNRYSPISRENFSVTSETYALARVASGFQLRVTT